MIPFTFVALAAALSTAAGGSPLDLGPPPSWELGVAAGGGWESNALGASAPVASGFGGARAWVARRFEVSDGDEVWLQLHYDGARYDSTPEVDLDRPELGLEWFHAFGARVTGRVIARAALRFQGDSARDGWDAGGRATLRFRLTDFLGLRSGAGFVHRETRDPAYGASSGQGELGLDAALWRDASAVVRYTLDAGTDTYYQAPAGGWGGGGMGWAAAAYGPGAGGGGGGMGAGAGTARATTLVAHGLSVDVLQGLPASFFVQAGYGLALERVAGASYVAHSVLAEVGWRH